jgi:hypothetical protein
MDGSQTIDIRTVAALTWRKSEPSGIADYDGLLEQTLRESWRPVFYA